MAVADTGGVAPAARRSGLPKSIVSGRLGRLETELAARELSPNGELRVLLHIAVPMSLGITQLAPTLAQFVARHSLLQLHVAFGDRFVDLIGKGVDLAICIGYLQDPALVASPGCV